jgi:transcriptional regulator GlxA family with amidase domain
MQLARQMLIDTNDAVIAIAESTGYQSEAAFGHVFKKTFSIASVAYRKSFQVLG